MANTYTSQPLTPKEMIHTQDSVVYSLHTIINAHTVNSKLYLYLPPYNRSTTSHALPTHAINSLTMTHTSQRQACKMILSIYTDALYLSEHTHNKNDKDFKNSTTI